MYNLKQGDKLIVINDGYNPTTQYALPFKVGDIVGFTGYNLIHNNHITIHIEVSGKYLGGFNITRFKKIAGYGKEYR